MRAMPLETPRCIPGPAMHKAQSFASTKDYPDVLDYYHSSLAGQTHSHSSHSRQISIVSTSSSEYSSISDTRDATSSDASSRATRRSSGLSEGGADRRRIAIVEMEPLSEKAHGAQQQDSSNTLRSRRGLQTDLSGLALVAPPDASPRTYDFVTPPSSAPIRTFNHVDGKDTSKTPVNHPSHHRSASEILPHKRSLSRDIGIVGTAQLTHGAKLTNGKNPNMHNQARKADNNATLLPPIFQHPKLVTPSPSPSPSPDLLPPLAPIRGLHIMKRDKAKESPTALLSPDSDASPPVISTPGIGEGKDVNIPVAPSVVVGLDATSNIVGGIRLVPQQAPLLSSADAATSISLTVPAAAADPALTYVNYQPGIHATAGPLPPPPRLSLEVSPSSPPPPRPPRLNSPLPPRNAARRKELEAVKQALQLPPSVSAALDAKVPKIREGISKESLTVPSKESGKDIVISAPQDNTTSFAVASSTSMSTMPSSPSFSDSSSSSYSMVQLPSGHRREGAFAPSLSESKSLMHPEHGQDEKKDGDTVGPVVDSRSNVPESSTGEQVPQVTVIPEPPQPPSPILESEYERTAENEDRGSKLHPDSENDEDNWVSITRASSPSAHHDRSTSLDGGANRTSIDRESSEAPSPPPKSFRNSFTTGLKRLSSRSLPRTPSLSSGSRRSSSMRSNGFSASSGGGVTDASRTPSPSVYSSPLPAPGSNQAQAKTPRQKIVQQWPSAMFCTEVHAISAVGGRKKMNTGERCAIYAQKINELYMHDCGLTEWVMEMRFRGPNSNPSTNSNNKGFPNPRSPAGAPFTPQPRQTSRSSVISDATFPTRPDASTATDLLSSHDDDEEFRDVAPPLPYPSLASAQRAAASNIVMTPPASIRSLGSNSNSTSNTHAQNSLVNTPATTLSTLSHAPTITSSKSGNGFFATLGRKASLSSKKPALGLGLGNLISSPISSPSSNSAMLMSPSSAHRLQKRPSHSQGKSASRSVNLGSIPMNTANPPSVVPGGPRAPPSSHNRAYRPQTFIPPLSSSFGDGSLGEFGPKETVSSSLERRPSLWELQVGYGQASQREEQIHRSDNNARDTYTPTQASAHLSYVHPYADPSALGRVARDQQQQLEAQEFDPYADLEFARQVERLASLLPNADRRILAGYLRRAGQDVLAIGQYLEDERNGTLKTY